jgi:hypothetical protein
MKTKIYNIWTEKVMAFIADITLGTELYPAVDEWLDKLGANSFQVGQGQYFNRHKEAYQQCQDPISAELFKLSKDQILAGFDEWFKSLVKTFSAFGTQALQEKYQTFRANCIAREDHPYISSRATITKALIDSGEIKNMDTTIAMFVSLIEAASISIESMEEFKRAQKDSLVVPRGPSSPVLHKEAVSPTKTTLVEPDLDLASSSSSNTL